MTGHGKAAVVTGAAGGIGLAVCSRLVRDGYRVHGVDLEAGRHRFDAAVPGARFHPADVTDQEQIAGVVDEIGDALAVAVACAGIVGPVAPLHRQTASDLRRVIDINVFGVWHLLAAAVPVMTRAGGGSIVAVSSVAGLGASPGLGGYGASKAAVLSLVRTAAIENSRTGIRVNAVCPGPVDTAMVTELEDARGSGDLEAGRTRIQKSIPVGRYGTPDDVAGAVAYLIGADAGFVTGAALTVDGGMRAL